MGSWSLAIEEQFYILAPCLLWLGSRKTVNLRRFGLALLLLFVTLPAIRHGVYRSLADWDSHRAELYLYFCLHTHADGLIAGLLVAVVSVDEHLRAWAKGAPFGLLVPAAAAVAVGLTSLQREAFNFFGLSLFFGSLTAACVFRPGWWTRLLEMRLLFTISRLSFGMYLVHWFFVEPLAEACSRMGVPASAQFLGLVGAVLAVSLLTAAVTFALIERPILRWRDRHVAR